MVATFNRIKEKEKKPSGSGAANGPVWSFYEKLSFLKEINSHKSVFSSINSNRRDVTKDNIWKMSSKKQEKDQSKSRIKSSVHRLGAPPLDRFAMKDREFVVEVTESMKEISGVVKDLKQILLV